MAEDSLTRPVATQRYVRGLVKHYANLMGFAHPYKISVAFHNSRRGNWCDDKDHDVYGYAQSQPQYHRCVVGFDLYHPKWHEKDETVDECVRHELAHVFVAMYTQAAQRFVTDEHAKALMEDLEDSLVQRFATMLIWAYAPEP